MALLDCYGQYAVRHIFFLDTTIGYTIKQFEYTSLMAQTKQVLMEMRRDYRKPGTHRHVLKWL